MLCSRPDVSLEKIYLFIDEWFLGIFFHMSNKFQIRQKGERLPVKIRGIRQIVQIVSFASLAFFVVWL